MEKHIIGVVGDSDDARARLEAADIEVIDDHPNFVSDDGSGSPDVAAQVEAASLEDAVEVVRGAILGSEEDEGEWQFRPVSD